MTKDKSNYLESVGREVQLRIAGGHGYITGPDMDDVEGAYDTGFEHGAASERERLNQRAAEILSGEARGARSGRSETWSSVMLGIAALNDITIERLLVEERERLAAVLETMPSGLCVWDQVKRGDVVFFFPDSVIRWLRAGGKDPSE